MITILYAALLALVYVALSVFVIRGRWHYKTGIGHGGHEPLDRRIRVHGNFAEYVPFGLLLLFLVDYSGFSPVIVHILGLMLLIGRLAHAFGLNASAGPTTGRAIGMALTFIMILVCAVLLLWKFIALRLTGF